jgi:hypothetical protein
MRDWELKVGLALWLFILLVWMCACSTETGLKHESVEWYQSHHQDWESWDQSQLKRADKGCPFSIFVPDGTVSILCEIPQPKIDDGVVSVEPKVKPTTYGSVREAAIYALAGAYALSHYYEVGGVITRLDDGTYGLGRPVTLWSGDHVEVNHNPLAVRGTIVADYHTHPCNKFSYIPSVMSGEDVVDNLEHSVIGYVADLCTGKVMEFDPSKDKVNPLTLEEGYKAREIGQIAVDGIVLDSEDARELLE